MISNKAVKRVSLTVFLASLGFVLAFIPWSRHFDGCFQILVVPALAGSGALWLLAHFDERDREPFPSK